MVPSVLRGLAEEKIVLLSDAKAHNLPFDIKGITRLVDKKGNTLGLLLDNKILEELEDDIDSQGDDFVKSLKESRISGKVKSSVVKKKSGLV
ncbi:hypothetical protein A2230_03085 [candidate division WOR-1 bacterium RIFOXYA2_FULL_36_21]|uniref:Uncharacterized protein n=1 Tax=candidate division WOR-1 bacterium RIFOXYB2_FULL_36_35 TaxID=1802578 RepID=A0A1F4S0W1_UNCSA|nr:MAG: hypothetical protein A2230_03085 [candidate division WOR-1 bacterium RIFOXYA2_FULL_36_21]OGC14064.1 MAG: hypothetical protein A2290_07010 [candidate division WOR-1 bacterium RIFOXYB2_FULL_36_35]OGC16759.1 MAG: hypothetical protein A2282_04075 [candidate division WOR-1 bacterium RIFOXYA12_FULL_36_13]